MGLFLEKKLLSGAVEVAFNRPERRNALSIDMVNQLCDRVEELESDSDNRVVVLRGEGKVFSAGLDLAEAADSSKTDASAAAVARVLELMRSTSLITVASVNGGAYAGGAGLMSACDIVLTEKTAKFGFPEARRGLLPALIAGSVAVKLRQADMRSLFIVGDIIDAERALAIGLVQYVTEPAELQQKTQEVVRSILEGGPDTIRDTKKLMNHLFPIAEACRPSHMLTSHLEARRSAEATEGLAAFNEKRKPAWMQKIDN